ncbi:unnamed protein product [Urochloa humidicola]
MQRAKGIGHGVVDKVFATELIWIYLFLHNLLVLLLMCTQYVVKLSLGTHGSYHFFEPTEEWQDPEIATEAVAEVLTSSKFLQNVDNFSKKSATSVVCARVQGLKAEVQAEKETNLVLRHLLSLNKE